MSDDIQYSVPFHKSWAIELKAFLRSSNHDISNGHAIQIVSAYWGFNSHDHIRGSKLHQSDRILPGFTANSTSASARATQFGQPVALILQALQNLHEEELDVFKSLAKRLVRNVLNNCDRVHGEYCHSALLTIMDAELCQKITSSPSFVDFLFGPYPFTCLQTFSDVKPHPGMNGHFMANPEAALNVAAFLHRPALDILFIKHQEKKMNTSTVVKNKTTNEDLKVSIPDPDDVQDLLDLVPELHEEVEHYRSEAEWNDDRYKAQNEDRRISLDDLPYGEELIRIRPLPHMLKRAESLLNQIVKNKLTSKDASEAFEEASELVENTRSTLADFTPLPS